MRQGRSALFALACLFAMECGATDISREAYYAEQIVKTLDSGEIVWLEAEGRKFLAIFTETEFPDIKNVAIVLHDKGSYPDLKPLIHVLRTELPKHRWSTLALQMPLRESGAENPDYYALFPSAAARLQAAIKFLNQKEFENIVIVGHGLGALMALQAQDQLRDDIKAMAVVGLPVPGSRHQAARTLEFIRKAEIPMLDLYSSRDVPAVADSAAQRRSAAKSNADYRQVRLDDDETMTVKRIYSWLRRIVEQIESAKDDEEAADQMPANDEDSPRD